MKKAILLIITIVFSLSSCNQRTTKRTDPQDTLFPEKPSRDAYEGFTWEKITGARLQFWSQRNPTIRVITDDALPGAKIEFTNNDTNTVYTRAVIQVFPLKNGRIEDVIELIKQDKRDEYDTEWDEKEACAFKRINSNREGVERYLLTPTGEAERELQEKGKQEPICTTCGGWGIWNSGMRYFEIHSSHPNKAIFVEIGQEAPLFDEMSITFTDAESNDSTLLVKGKLVIGHEIRSFIALGDTAEYWIVDKSGQLVKEYKKVTGTGSKPYTPVYTELKVMDTGKSEDGFAADYAGVYQVVDIIKVSPME